MLKTFWRYVYSFWHNSRTWQTADTQTDTAWRHGPRLCIASRGKYVIDEAVAGVVAKEHHFEHLLNQHFQSHHLYSRQWRIHGAWGGAVGATAPPPRVISTWRVFFGKQFSICNLPIPVSEILTNLSSQPPRTVDVSALTTDYVRRIQKLRNLTLRSTVYVHDVCRPTPQRLRTAVFFEVFTFDACR